MRVDDAGADGDGGDGVDSDGGNSMGRGEGDIFPPCVHLPTEIRAPPPYSRLQLNAGLNFIVGKNGSGKSAMCNAAQVRILLFPGLPSPQRTLLTCYSCWLTQVAFGATARGTERGTNMKAFIRYRQPETSAAARDICTMP